MAGQVSKRNPGAPLDIPAKEWNAIADAVNFGVSQSRAGGQLSQSITVLVRNDAGEDLDRFDCASLAAPLFTLATNGSADLIFSLVKADKDKPPAILTEPIAHDATNKRYGRVWIHGLAYAFVGPGSTTSKFGVPTATNNRLTPGTNGDIRLLAVPSASVETLLPVLLGAGAANGAVVLKTPVGGIDAATFASGEYTLGTANCTVYEIVEVAGIRKAIATSDTLAVSNTVPIKIKGNALIHAKIVSGQYLVDVEPCTVTYLETP